MSATDCKLLLSQPRLKSRVTSSIGRAFSFGTIKPGPYKRAKLKITLILPLIEEWCFDGLDVAVVVVALVAAAVVVVVKSVKKALSTFDRQVLKIEAWKRILVKKPDEGEFT